MKSKRLQWVLVLVALAVVGIASRDRLSAGGANATPSPAYTWTESTSAGSEISHTTYCPSSSYAISGGCRSTRIYANLRNSSPNPGNGGSIAASSGWTCTYSTVSRITVYALCYRPQPSDVQR
jgi:hypothetical protein